MDNNALRKFLSKIDVDNTTGCWVWKASKFCNGYGQFYHDGEVLAHRVSFAHYKGTIPYGLVIRHNCPCGDNTLCVNPDHLLSGTQKENIDDMCRKGRHADIHGSDIGNSKLSDADILVIRHLYSNKYRFSITQYDLAEMFGVSQSQIQRIVTRKTWKHI